jgi:hypothetical protein
MKNLKRLINIHYTVSWKTEKIIKFMKQVIKNRKQIIATNLTDPAK